jgi:anti-sigma factor RsiW
MTDAEPLDCDEFVELVTAYLEDALDPADRQRVLDHLDLCDGCSTYLEQIRATVRAVGDLPEPVACRTRAGSGCWTRSAAGVTRASGPGLTGMTLTLPAPPDRGEA